MYTWDAPLTVTLKVEQWLDIQIALSDARRWNDENGYNICAKDISRLKNFLHAQIGEPIEAASAAATAEFELA